MDRDIPQKKAPKDVYITYEDLDNRNMQRNQPLCIDSVIQHHNMHSNSTEEQPSTANTMVPQYAQTYLAESVQQLFNNRVVHQEVDEPTLLETRDHAIDLNNKTSESKRHLPANCDEKAEKNMHKCNICHKGFVSKSKLKRHVLIHTGEKPYVCEVCSKSFSVTSSLNKHKLLHTDQKQYVCNICDQKCIRDLHLKDHFWIHTGVKRHLCEICNNRFTTKGNLDRHRHQHLKSRLFKRNTEEAKTQIIIPTSKSQVLEDEVHQQLQKAQKQTNIFQTDFAKHLKENAESAVEQHQIVHEENQVNHIQALSDYCEMLFAENCGSDEQILMNSEENGNLEQVQEIRSINTLGTQGFNNMIIIDQQDIADHEYQCLPQNGNQTLAEIVPETFTVNEQQPCIYVEQPEINYIVHPSSTMFPVEVNQNMHPDSWYGFP